MHAEFKNFRLHFYPETIKEFQEIHLWVEVNQPCNAFIHRPVLELIKMKQLLLSNEDTYDILPHQE